MCSVANYCRFVRNRASYCGCLYTAYLVRDHLKIVHFILKPACSLPPDRKWSWPLLRNLMGRPESRGRTKGAADGERLGVDCGKAGEGRTGRENGDKDGERDT